MKKAVQLLSVATLVVFLSGCSLFGTKVVCKSEANDYVDYDSEITFKFKDNKLTSANAKMTFDDKDDAKETYDHFKDSDSDYEYKLSGKKITSKMPKEDIDEYNDIYDDKDELIESFESNGYTCK